MEPKKIISVLLIAAVVIFILGLLSLIPSPGASKPCLLGYKAKCSFSPVSTLILFWTALVLYTVRSRMMNESGILGSYILLIILSIVFLAGIVFFSFRYAAINTKNINGSKIEIKMNTVKRPAGPDKT